MSAHWPGWSVWRLRKPSMACRTGASARWAAWQIPRGYCGRWRLGCRQFWQWSAISWCANLPRRQAGQAFQKSKARWKSYVRCAGGALFRLNLSAGWARSGRGWCWGVKGQRCSLAGISGAWWGIFSACAAARRGIRCWQPVRRQGCRRRLTRRWRGSCLSSKRCARSFATTLSR
ncbi:hypothetical protein D3C86_1386140 [compost metagenome]